MMLGDLTYPYQSLDGKTQTLKIYLKDKHEISKEIKMQKTIIISGESFIKI